jgi:hypothetical protein
VSAARRCINTWTKPAENNRKMFDTKLFIKKIQLYPEIFDPANAGFKQIHGKSDAWDKLAEDFKVDCEFPSNFQSIA